MKHILIVDDDIHINKMLDEVLVHERYMVSHAYSGTEALLFLADTKPDLILLDLMLPGLSGEELLPQISDIPIIVMSAKVDVEDKVSLLLGGAVDYVTKPFDTKELLARTVLPNYWNADFIVQNQTQTTEDINSLKPAIEDSFVEEIRKLDGIKDFHLVEGTPIIFPYVLNSFSDMWITNYIDRTPYLSSEDVKADYKANPSNYYGMLIGIDEEQFDYVNQSLDNPIDKQDFLNGESCIVQYEGSEIPKEYLNQRVFFNLQGKQYEITVEAVSYDTQYSGRDIGASLIVSQDYLNSLISKPTTLNMYIYYNQKYDEVLEKKITSLVEDSPYSNDLHIESQFENMRTIQESQGEMMEIGTIIALLLLLVGVLNYTNTIASSIQNRKLTFSVMESIGMSKKQINQLLIREGVLYALFSVFITLTIGSVITYICFESMNYMEIPFNVPVFPLFSAIILVMLICMITPLLSYKKLAGNRSIVERLRDYE